MTLDEFLDLEEFGDDLFDIPTVGFPLQVIDRLIVDPAGKLIDHAVQNRKFSEHVFCGNRHG